MRIPQKKRLERLTPDEPIYLTPHGIERMKSELERLRLTLPEAAAEAAHTAGFGDRSENDAYKQAKGILRRTQRRIWTLEDQMKRVVEIAIPKPGENKAWVELGSTVVLETPTGVEKTFQILGTLETNPSRGIISHRSPLGAALMGKQPGEVVTIKTARGAAEYKILKIN